VTRRVLHDDPAVDDRPLSRQIGRRRDEQRH
jgi:hypothetical protein